MVEGVRALLYAVCVASGYPVEMNLVSAKL